MKLVYQCMQCQMRNATIIPANLVNGATVDEIIGRMNYPRGGVHIPNVVRPMDYVLHPCGNGVTGIAQLVALIED